MNYNNHVSVTQSMHLILQEQSEVELSKSSNYELITYIKRIYNYYNNKYHILKFKEHSYDGLTNILMFKENNLLIIKSDEINIIENKIQLNNVIKTLKYKLKITNIKNILNNYNKLDIVLAELLDKHNQYIEKDNVISHIINFTKYVSKKLFCIYDIFLDKSMQIYCDDGSIIRYNSYDIEKIINKIKSNNIISLLSQLKPINVNMYYDPTFNTDSCEYDLTDFTCPITYEIIINPIMTRNNFYDIKNLKRMLLKGFDYDPLTRQPLEFQPVSENYLKYLAKFHRENIQIIN